MILRQENYRRLRNGLTFVKTGGEFMKLKRLLALIGAVLLIGMYISTLVFSLMNSEFATDMFKVSIVLTIIIPFLLYAFTLIYNVLKNSKDKK